MPENYILLLKQLILQTDTLVNATFSGSQKGKTCPWIKVLLRPVLIKGVRHLQFSYFDGKKDLTRNYAGPDSLAPLDELLALPFNSITLRTAAEKIRVQFTQKGKAILHREKLAPAAAPVISLAHDRSKNLLLPPDQPDPFLQTVGIMTAQGKIKADMQDKFRQIDRFLQLIDHTANLAQLNQSPLLVIDCGCGSAQLTFAAYHYLTHILKLPAQLIGVDLKADLLKKRAEQAQALGWTDLRFEPCAIIDFVPPRPPDIVLALHACDTATDEALAQAVTWNSRLIFSVPCCHHHLQAQLASTAEAQNPAHRPIFRQGILKERLGDILTDAFRAQILRLMGYRADVVEFISSEHTAKNLMIRAEKIALPVENRFAEEYLALKREWGVTPYLETLLGEKFISAVDGRQ